MSTVGKAISLLNLFGVHEPELGLSGISRRSGFDKATTRRLLMALSENGFVEQDAVSRAYRLGPGLTRLARIREAHFPFLQISLPQIRELAVLTAETVHLAEASNGQLLTVHVEHPARANRVNVDIGDRLPLHCTASGIAYLAHVRDTTLKAALAAPLGSFTQHTVTDPEVILASIGVARKRGYSVGDRGYEDGVFSVAAAVLGPDGYAIGTVAVAAPTVRSNKTAVLERGRAVATAAQRITEELNGEGFEAVRSRAVA